MDTPSQQPSASTPPHCGITQEECLERWVAPWLTPPFPASPPPPLLGALHLLNQFFACSPCLSPCF